MQIGYKLCSEEQGPAELVEAARRAEEAGFSFAAISDHFHPWIDAQGQSSFVWTVLGGIAQATTRLRVGTAVTCPTMRTHPAIIAHAAATTAAMLPGRFFLGVGTGENLNEHILGHPWPAHDVRAAMLEEAIEIMRLLWRGKMTTYRGKYFTVENARLYTLPDEPPPVYVAASGPEAANLAGRIGDGLLATAPNKKLVESFQKAGNGGKPRLAEVTVCWAKTEAEATRTAHRCWSNAGLQGALSSELPLPEHFEQAAQTVRPEDLTGEIVLGPDPERYVKKVKEYTDAGFDHVWFHQVGPDQEGFFRFFERELAPRLDAGGTSGMQKQGNGRLREARTSPPTPARVARPRS